MLACDYRVQGRLLDGNVYVIRMGVKFLTFVRKCNIEWDFGRNG